MSPNSGPLVQKPPVRETSVKLRNHGPWTTVEYTTWPEFSIGHTTVLGDGAGAKFNQGSLTELFVSHLSPERFYMAEQVHGSSVSLISGPSKSHLGSDGLISRGGGNLLGIRTADCMPVYVKPADVSAPPTYGIVHAGWRGLLAGIVPSAVDNFFVGPVDLFVGPHIDVDSYEVGDEVLKKIRQLFDLDREGMIDHDLVTPDNHADLFEILRYQLAVTDVDVQTVYHSPLSTQDESPVRLLSYRRNQTQKRMLNWIICPQEGMSP